MDEQYRISFFKPASKQAAANRNMTLWLVSVWALAVFGFHIVLRVIEKPVPEPAYNQFTSVWENVNSNTFSDAELKVFSQSTLQVLSKVNIAPAERNVLDDAFSWSVYNLVADSLQSAFVDQVRNFEQNKNEITDISDKAYVEAKVTLGMQIAGLIGLSSDDVRSKIAPLEVVSSKIETLDNETVAQLPGIMEKHLIHNQSVLTDTKILGFPFHYFYTAVFLLILFIALCLGYCIRTDQLNAQFNVAD